MDKTFVRLVGPSFKKYWVLLVGTIAFALLSASFEGLGVGLIIPFLQNLSTEGDSFSTGIGWIDANILGVGMDKTARMIRICGVIIISTFLRGIFSYLASFCGIKGRASVVEDLRMKVIDQLRSVSLAYFSNTRSGNIVNLLTNEMSRVAVSFNTLTVMASQGAMIAIYLGLMILISWKLTLVVSLFFLILSLSLSRVIGGIRKEGRLITSSSSQFVSTATEFISGIKTVAAFNTQEYERERLLKETQGVADAVVRTAKLSELVRPIVQVLVSVLLVAVVLAAILWFDLNVALLLTFVFALIRMMPSILQINNERGKFAQSRAAFENLSAMLNEEDKPYILDGPRETPRLSDAIVLKDVSFGYDPGELVLRNLNIEIARGSTVAIVGGSGAGKTTVVDLIPRFHDPVEGAVLWDGIDVREFTVASLRNRIAVVSQDTFIFHDTVTNNIAYGLKNVPLSQVVEAADRANAREFIEEMPNKFNTILGDRGVRISGGQRQRLAIARALLRDPEVLILDEATSALDSISEKLVQQSLERLMDGRTVIAIAHRLSTLENADWVVVMEDGVVVEQGQYKELLDRKGRLWTYHALQYQLP